MSDSNNFHHLRKQRKLFHKHFSFQFPTSYLKFDFHLVCFIKPSRSDLKSVAGNYPAAEGKKRQWGSSISLAQKEPGGGRLGSLAEKQLVSTRNCLSEVRLASPWPHSDAWHCLQCGEDNVVHFMGPVEEVQGLWVAAGGHLMVYDPGTSSPLQESQHS